MIAYFMNPENFPHSLHDLFIYLFIYLFIQNL